MVDDLGLVDTHHLCGPGPGTEHREDGRAAAEVQHRPAPDTRHRVTADGVPVRLGPNAVLGEGEGGGESGEVKTRSCGGMTDSHNIVT